MNVRLRAKMRVASVTHVIDANGGTECELVKLVAVTGDTPENKNWSKWTPNGHLELTVSNSHAFGFFRQDYEFFVDLTPANESGE